MTRKPCQYCQAEDGVDRLGIGYSGRCGAHYYRLAFPSDVEAAPDAEAQPVKQTPDEGLTMSMFP